MPTIENYINGGCEPITLDGILRVQFDSNKMLAADDDGMHVYLTTIDKDKRKFVCFIDRANSQETNPLPGTVDATAYYDNYLHNYVNVVPALSEIRIPIHDMKDKSKWDGRTHGNYTSYVEGSTVFGEFQMLLDDQTYEWVWGWKNASGQVTSWLDRNVEPAVWKSANGAILVSFFDDEWRRNDTSGVVTSSLFRIKPAPGERLEIKETITTSNSDTMIVSGSMLQYKVFMYLNEGVAAPGAPAGVYPVKNWAYKTFKQIVDSANDRQLVGNMIVAKYNYEKTEPPILDSYRGQYLDISLKNDIPVVSDGGSVAALICMRYMSF